MAILSNPKNAAVLRAAIHPMRGSQSDLGFRPCVLHTEFWSAVWCAGERSEHGWRDRCGFQGTTGLTSFVRLEDSISRKSRDSQLGLRKYRRNLLA